MKYSLALSLFLFSATALAECPRSLPDAAPAVPDGATASAETMLSAQTATRQYVENIEGYLECWEPMLTSVSHNGLVNRAMSAADAYNRELQRFRQRADLALRD